MRTETIQIFKFEELSESAKENAREWFRRASSGDSFRFDFVIEEFQTVAEMLGFEIAENVRKNKNDATVREPRVFWSGFCSQGDGASFEGEYRYKRGALAAVRAYAPNDATLHNIAKRLQAAQARIFYAGVFVVKQSGLYCHEMTMNIAESFARYDSKWYSGSRYDNSHTESAEADILECARDLARWLYKNLENENDYMESAEYIDECITANEYEFTETGEIY
jgi:hypothetical protein